MENVSIVIPVYNAEQTIELLCETLVALYAEKYGLEIILVNDFSNDNSDAICRLLQSRHAAIVTYIKLAKNFGEHNALMAGLHHATGDYCVMMDDDLQNPPEEVGKLVEEIKKGYDVVYTCFEEKRYGIFRRLGSFFNDKMATLVLKKPASLYLSSFKAVNRFLAQEIIKYDGHDPYIDGVILRSTGSIGSVRVTHRERSYSRSGYTFGKLVSLWGSMVVNYSLFPIRVIGVLGTFLVALSICYSLYKAFDDIATRGILSNYETLMSANLLFRGFALIALSVLGEYVGRIYLALNKDPQFVIRDRVSARKKTQKVELVRNTREDGRKEG
ncbi:MAG: glycosyltransferase family 2 protein [Nitrospiraceae bacterium]|nr:glycosyltransferase family 2 protein [Nitrospiraceae bacterium]